MKNALLSFTKKLIAIFIILEQCSTTTFAGSGIFESYVIVQANGGSANYYDLFASTGNPDFQGLNFGTFSCTGSLVIKGGQNKTYKNGTDNILNGYLYYRVYKNGTDPSLVNFTSINLGFDINLNGSGDQQWTNAGGNTNVLQGLSDGTYTIEVYTSADFTYNGGSGTHYQNVGGANYSATFTVSNPINITTQLLTPAAFCSGSNVTLATAATGADTYIWQEEISAGNWANISGANGSMNIAGETVSLTLTNVTTTKKVRCLFTNCGGINKQTTAEVILVPQQPTITLQPISQTDCDGNVVDFKITASAGSTFVWQRKKPSDANFVTVSATTNSIITSTSTDSELKVRNIGNAENPHLSIYRCVVSDANSCSIISNPATLSVNSINNIADSPAICAGGSTSFSASFVGTTTSIKWQKGTIETTAGSYSNLNDSPPNILGTTTNTLSLSNVPFADNNTFYRVRAVFTTLTNSGAGTCTKTQDVNSASNSGKLVVNDLPTAPTANSASRCDAGTVTLSATSALGTNESFRWYDSNVSTTILGTATNYTTSSLAVGTHTFYLSVYNSNTTCESTRTPVTVIVNPLPTITLGSVADICNTATSFSLPFSATTNSPNQYSISAGSPALSGFSAISNAALGSSPIDVTIPANAIPNTYQFFISVKNASTTCVSADQTFSVRINETPVAPTVVSPINYCHNSPTAILSATVNDANTLIWYGTNSSGGTSSLTAPTPSSSTVGTISYYVSQKNIYNCEGARASIDVVINAIPAPPSATTAVAYCKNSTATALSATEAGTNSLLWYDENDNILGTAPTPNTSTLGTQIFRVSQKSPSPANCESPKTTITVTINDLPEKPSVVSPVGYCQNSTATSLSATATGANTLLWYGTSATGGTSSGTAPTPLTTSAGTTSYYVSQKDVNNCESLREKIDVEITPTLAGTITGINAFCITGALNKSTTLTANPTGGNGSYTYQWQNLSGNIASATNQTYEVNTQSANSDTYKVTISSGYCTATANLTVTKQGWTNEPSVSITPPTGDICGSGSKTLSINSPTAGIYRWYADAATLSQIAAGISFTTPNLTTTTTYYVAREQQITANLTCQTDRTAVPINVSAIPEIPIIVNSANKTTFCNSESGFSLSISCNAGNGQYRLNNGAWTNGNSVSILPSNYNLVSTLKYDFKCSLSASCESAVASTSIIINPVPNAPTISGNTNICSGSSTTLTASGCAGGSIVWSDGTTATSIAVTSAGTYHATCTVNACVSAASATQTIVVNTIPSAPTVTSNDADNIICAGASVQLSVSDCAGTVIWSNGTTATSITVTSAGTYNATCTVNGCVSAASATQTVVVNSLPTTPTIVSDDADNTVCAGTSVTLSVSNCGGTVVWSNATSATSIIVSSSGTYSATCMVNGCMSVASAPQIIVVTPLPSISSQPTDKIACKSTTVRFIVSATNVTSYQWQRKKPTDATFVNVDDTMTGISGSTTNDLRLTSVGTQNPDQSLYRCIITNNNCSVISSEALLRVNEFTGTLASQTKCEGASATFSTPAYIGTINSYQWEQRPLTTGPWTPIANTVGKYTGATTNTLEVSNLTSTDAVYYRCTVVFSTGTGTCNVSTDDGKLTVTVITPPTVSGLSAICSGSSTTLTASGCAGTINWNTGAVGSTISANIVGTYSATCTQNSCTSQSSNVHILAVNPLPNAPTITSDDADNIVCAGTSIKLSVSDCSGTVIWSNGITASSINVLSSGTYSATCTVNTCVSVASATQTIVVNSIPNSPVISGNLVICSGTSTTLTANGCLGVVTWNTGATGSTLSVSSAATYSATCTINNCESTVSAPQIVVLNTIPTAPTITGNTSVCVGKSTALTANGCTGLITWNTGTTGNILTASAGTYTATCTENSCISSPSLAHIITENPSPTITLGSISSICNAATTFDLPYTATTNSPDKYTLTSLMPDFVAVSETILPLSPISITIPSGKTGTHAFTLNIKNSATNCESSQTFNVTILPTLLGGSIEASAGTVNCAGYNAGLISSVSLASGGKSAYIYQWQSSTDNQNFIDISGETGTTYDPPVLTETTYFRRKVTDACGGVAYSSNVHQVQIVPDPQISLIDASEQVICSGSSISLSATVIGGSGTCVPTWQSSPTQSGTYTTEQVGGLSFGATLSNATSSAITKYYRAIYACSGTGSGSCNQSTSAVVKVTINPLPSVPIANGGGSICLGSSTILTASGCNGVIVWSNGATSTSLSVFTAGSYSAVCTNSCGTSVASNELVVNVSTVTPPILSGSTTVCGGQTATLTAASCAGTVVWSNGSSGTSISVTPSTTTSYTATCSVDGCTSSISEPVTVTVAPSIDFTVGSIADVCNSSTSFSLPYTITLGLPDKYSLTSTMAGFVSISDANLPLSPLFITIPSGQTGTFSFTLTLKINSTGCSKSQTFNVTILPTLLGGSIEASAGTVNCAGYNAGLISSVSLASGGKSAYIYQWQSSTDNQNFIDISGETGTTYDPPVLTETTYFRRKVTDACGSVAYSSNVHQVQIVPDPQISLIDASEQVICSGGSISLSATVLGGSGTCVPTWQSSPTQSGTYTTEQVGGLSFGATLSNATSSAITKYYRAIYACSGTGSGSCNQSTSAVVKVTINPLPSVPVISPASVILCPTQSATLTASGCSGIVTWNGGQTGSSISVSLAGSYTATCSLNNCISAESIPTIVTIASGGTLVSPPTITGTTTICNGQSTNLTATGCAGLVTWSNGNTGTLISVNPSITTNYTATCSDATCTSNSSNLITVTVNNYPSITTQPKNESDCDGNSATFTVTASSATSYQWQRKIPNGTFTDISNATSRTLTISNVGSVTDPNQTEYRVMVSNENCSVTSTVAILTVNSVVGSLADQTICEGENASFSLTNIIVTGNIQGYQWQQRVGTSGTWNDIAGATSTTLSINAATNADEQYYRCKVTFAVGSSTCARYTTEDDSNGAKLSILTASAPTITGTNTICLGKSTTLTANNCDGTITWSSGQSTTKITVSPTTNTSYTVSCVSNQCGFNVSSVPYLVTVNATPQPEIITYDVITPTILTFAARTTVPNATLMWYNRASGGTGTTTAPSFSNVGTYSYWVTQTDPITGCESARLPIIAKVLDYFHITQQPTNQIDCKGNSVYLGVVAVGPNPAFTYQWQRKRPNEPDFVNLVEEGNGIKGWYARTMVVSNVGDVNNPNQTQYRCIVSNNGQSLTSEISTLTVNSINGSLPNLGICVGATNEFNLQNYFTIIGNVMSYQWQTRPGTSGVWTNLNDGNGIAGSNSSILKFTNASYEQGVYYRCLVKFNTQGFECTEPTDAAKLIVSGFPPAPAVSNVFYCQNANAVRLKVDSPIQNLVWYSEATGGAGSKTAPIPNTSVAGEFKYYVADRTDEGCEGPRAAINVGVGALPPAPKNTTPSTVDEGSVLRFSAEGTPSENQVLRWYTSPTTSTFTTTAPTFTATGTYNRYVAQVSAFGCVGPRTLITATIIPSLKFTKQPISQSDCDGNSVTFSVTATAPTTFTYQWQRQKPNEMSYTDLTNETSNSLKISDVGSIDNPNLTKYRCVIKNDKNTVISEEATLTVNEIIGTLATMSLCDGKASKLSFNSLTITGKVTKYQWQKKSGSTYTDILTDAAGVAIINEIGTYRGRVFFEVDKNTTCNRTTNDLKVEAKPTPAVPLVTDQIVCQNLAFDIKKAVSATNSLLWYESAIDSTGDKIIPKVDTSKLGKTTYFVSQISTFGCESERKSFDVLVAAIPEKPITSDLAYCRNAPSLALVATTLAQNQVVWYSTLTTKDAFSKTPIPNTKTDGETVYFAAAKNIAGCESERVPLKISVAPCIATFENNFNNCLQVSADSVKGNQWFDLYDNLGHLYASVNPNGLNLGKVSISIRHYGRGSAAIPTTKNDTKLMARYVDFQSSLLNEFSTPVSLRVYYQNDELEEYKTATNLPNLTTNDFNIVHYDGIREDCGFENNDNFVEGDSYVIYKNVVGNQITKEFFYLQFDVNDFSEIGATANDFTEITFSGEETENQTIQLNWQSKYEIKAEKYILERSADCKNFAKIGEIKANGTSSIYENTDFQPLAGKSCYRLVYIDKDGTKKYLDAIEVNFTDTNPICSVFPNPWTKGDEINLYLRNIKEKEIKLYDMLGHALSYNLNKNDNQIIKIRPDVYLSKGVHFLVVIGEDGKKCVQKIVINP